MNNSNGQNKSIKLKDIFIQITVYSVLFVCVFLTCRLLGIRLFGLLSGKFLILSFSATILITTVVYKFFKRHRTNISVLIVSLTSLLFISDMIIRSVLAEKMFHGPGARYAIDYDKMSGLLMRYKKNVKYEGRVYGDIVSMSGLLEHKEERDMLFVTDQLGFRNYPNKKDEEIDYILLADSFGAGIGTHQDSMLLHWLELETGKNIYNLSMPGYPINEFTNLVLEAPKLKLKSNTEVIWLIFTGNDLPFPQEKTKYDRLYAAAKNHSIPDLLEENILKLLKIRIGNYLRRSSFRILMTSIRFRNKVKNNAENGVTLKEMPNGSTACFLNKYISETQISADAIRKFGGYEEFEETFDAAKRWSEENDIDLTIFLIPAKNQVYEWMFDNSKNEGHSGFNIVMDSITQKFAIPYYDTTNEMEQLGIEKFANNGKLLFWRDDTHLNVEGSRVMAKIIARQILNSDEE